MTHPQRLKHASEVVRAAMGRKLAAPCWKRLLNNVVPREAEILCERWTRMEELGWA